MATQGSAASTAFAQATQKAWATEIENQTWMTILPGLEGIGIMALDDATWVTAAGLPTYLGGAACVRSMAVQ
jgi:hypothetical protein